MPRPTTPVLSAKPELHAEEPPPSASAFAFKRIHFSSVPPVTAHVLLKLAEPPQRVALLENLKCEWSDAATYPAESHGAPDFDCLCLNASQITKELLQRADKWFQCGPANPAARVKIEGGWVRWKPGRAVICAPMDEWDGMLAALADFSFYEFELRKLEREIAADWDAAETDLALASDVSSDDLKRFGEISAATRQAFMRRIRLAKIERPLHKCQAPLPPRARKLAQRLRDRFEIEDRAETLDGQLEVYEYVYEMANQRMSEYKNFRREYLLEILIVLLLAGELLVMIWDVTHPR